MRFLELLDAGRFLCGCRIKWASMQPGSRVTQGKGSAAALVYGSGTAR